MNNYPLIEQYAQEQTAIYENFLQTLQAFILQTKASGMTLSAMDLNKAEDVFNTRARFTTKLLAERTANLLTPISSVSESIYFAWVGDVEEELYKTFERCLIANKAKFKNQIRFGSAFDGLNDLLGDVHGAMGNVVQLLATKIKWSYRAKNGNCRSCAKDLYIQYKLLASRAKALQFLYEYRLTNKVINLCDKHGNTILQGTATELMEDDDIPIKYFGFNEENYFAVSS